MNVPVTVMVAKLEIVKTVLVQIVTVLIATVKK